MAAAMAVVATAADSVVGMAVEATAAVAEAVAEAVGQRLTRPGWTDGE